MQDKSIVYWASPNETAAMPNTARNMATNNLVKTRLILDKILDNIEQGDKVGVKVHVGESHNTHYLRPDYVREVVNAIKAKGGIPTLIETQGRGSTIEEIEINDNYTICVGHRKTSSDHSEIARLHGYHESVIGAPLKFIDGEEGIDGKIVKIKGNHFNEVWVAEGLFEFDKLVIISHFKGHPYGGFGGALKQLGLGFVTKHNKVLAHFDGKLSINPEKCDPSKCNQECLTPGRVEAVTIVKNSALISESECYGCFKCSQECPVEGAIKRPKWNRVDKFIERFIDNATAAIAFGPEKIRYINFALDIPLMCDCVSNASVPVIPDLGIFGSSDPVAIDKACFDKETEAPGLPFLNKDGEWTEPLQKGVEKFQALMPIVNPAYQFEAALKNKIGSTEYDLIKI
jgi:uncharacterized Fe-S center protein